LFGDSLFGDTPITKKDESKKQDPIFGKDSLFGDSDAVFGSITAPTKKEEPKKEDVSKKVETKKN